MFLPLASRSSGQRAVLHSLRRRLRKERLRKERLRKTRQRAVLHSLRRRLRKEKQRSVLRSLRRKLRKERLRKERLRKEALEMSWSWCSMAWSRSCLTCSLQRPLDFRGTRSQRALFFTA